MQLSRAFALALILAAQGLVCPSSAQNAPQCPMSGSPSDWGFNSTGYIVIASRLEAEVSGLSSLIDVLSSNPSLADSDDRSEEDSAIGCNEGYYGRRYGDPEREHLNSSPRFRTRDQRDLIITSLICARN